MHILSSALRMDATSVDKEVITTGRNNEIISSGLSGHQFRIPLDRLGPSELRAGVSELRQNISAKSIVEKAGTRSSHIFQNGELVSTVVREALGGPAEIRRAASAGEATSLAARESLFRSSPGQRRTLNSMTLGLERVERSSQQLDIGITGQALTEDGRNIQLKLELELEEDVSNRQRNLEERLSSRFIDPLVLSFTDGLTVLSGDTFSFDLNFNGEAESISGLKSGSGYLAMDHNGDGIINDGLELFGPESGSGYGELEIFDVDGNDWIDSGDPAFHQLRIWMGAGRDDARLVGLAEAGVGAISLTSSATRFNLKDDDGRILGQVSNGGLFLTASGEPRPLAEIDMADLDDPGSQDGVNDELQVALLNLQRVITARRQRLEQMAAIRLAGLQRKEEREDWFFQRFFTRGTRD